MIRRALSRAALLLVARSMEGDSPGTEWSTGPAVSLCPTHTRTHLYWSQHRDGQADQAAGCGAPPTQNSAIDRGIRGDWNQDSSCCWAGACLEGRKFLGDKIILGLVQGRPFMGACNDQNLASETHFNVSVVYLD